MLNKLEEKLREIDDNVFYGVAGKNDKNIMNYIVYGRETTDINNDKNAFTDRYVVAIVRENYIPENTFDGVLDKVEEAGFRLSDKPVEYDYLQKNADTVVEIAIIRFHKARRR